MLKLNPNNNQGIRYLLLACLLRRGDAEAVKALLSSYGDEWSAYWLYGTRDRSGSRIGDRTARIQYNANAADPRARDVAVTDHSPGAPRDANALDDAGD